MFFRFNDRNWFRRKMFSKILPEDVVEYSLYHKYVKDEAQSQYEMEKLMCSCLALVASETNGYLWQNQPFNLHLKTEKNITSLYGSTNFADSVNDEWFVVYLLHKITSTHKDLIATVTDNDGQFLLIESADVLPKWLTPDSSANRVFISNGILHIIMKPASPADIARLPAGSPTLLQGIETVSQYPWLTQASYDIVACIQRKISGFPAKALESIHYANVFVNKKIVYLLDNYPHLISACVQAFYFRDPIDIKACQNFKHFLPADRVWSQIPMTRCHYAQLVQQHFTPHKNSGYVVSDQVPQHLKKGHVLGMKIAHGFEMLCCRMKKMTTNILHNNSDVFDTAMFQKFLKALCDCGYFQNEVEGSKLYQKLLDQAKVYFMRSSTEGHSFYNQDANQVLNFLSSFSEKLVLSNLNIYDQESIPADCSDEWMYLTEDDIDDMVKEMNDGFQGLSKTSSHKHIGSDVDVQETLKHSADKVHEFVDDMSGVEGVEVKSMNSIDFHCDEFLNSLHFLLGISKSSKSQTNESDSDQFLDSEDSSVDESSFDSVPSQDGESIVDYMQQMDQELANTSVGKSFKMDTGIPGADISSERHTDDSVNHDQVTDENSDSVNIDMNLVQNFIESVRNEDGHSGPVSNVMSSVGINLRNVNLCK